MNIFGKPATIKATDSPAGQRAAIAAKAPSGRELQNALATELLDAIRKLDATSTELIGQLRGGMTNSVLQAGLYALNTDGIWSGGFRVPMGSVYVANHGSGDLTVSGSAPGNGAPQQGISLSRIPAGCYAVINLASANLTVYGNPGEYVSLQVFAKSQPPSAGLIASNAGVVTTAVGSNPAAGAEISETVPAGEQWELLAVRFTLVTDATVATRAPSLLIDDGTNTILRIAAASTQTASLTVAYNWMADLGYEKTSASANVQGSFPRLTLLGGYRIRTTTGAMVAGDDYGAPVLHYRRFA